MPIPMPDCLLDRDERKVAHIESASHLSEADSLAGAWAQGHGRPVQLDAEDAEGKAG
jgi:hypothetical protein